MQPNQNYGGYGGPSNQGMYGSGGAAGSSQNYSLVKSNFAMNLDEG